MSLREAKIRQVLESDAYFCDRDRVREIERLCDDSEIRSFAEKEIAAARGGWKHVNYAARAIDDEQYYYDRRKEDDRG